MKKFQLKRNRKKYHKEIYASYQYINLKEVIHNLMKGELKPHRFLKCFEEFNKEFHSCLRNILVNMTELQDEALYHSQQTLTLSLLKQMSEDIRIFNFEKGKIRAMQDDERYFERCKVKGMCKSCKEINCIYNPEFRTIQPNFKEEA